ncbi:histamine H2 receptor-like [Bolinopsis microptera]|uniref:histamine H2 receptor-like n=1 Tax=Bolinopsis microptera TaxID=2820187 RepID=UPI00307AC3AE
MLNQNSNLSYEVQRPRFTLDEDLVKNDLYIGMMCLVLAIFIVMSNALLMIALWRQRARKLNTHTLVFWLAVNDMLVGIFVIPSTLPSLFTKRQIEIPQSFCAVSGVVTSVTVTMSVLIVMCLTVDRFIAVKFPVRYPRICSRVRIHLITGIVWVEAILFSVIPLLPQFGGYRFNPVTCTCNKKIGRDKTNPFSISFFALCVVVPLITVVAAGSAIVIILLRKPKLSAQLQRIREACVTTLLIVGAYFACVLPYTIAFIIWNKRHKSKESLMHESWPMYCLIITFCNSLLNPIIYLSRSGRMRKEVKAVMRQTSSILTNMSSRRSREGEQHSRSPRLS